MLINFKPLFYFFLISMFFLSFSFSNELKLKLIEGGCVGYENTLLELSYENKSVVTSSNFEITVYNGPIKGLGVLSSFTADAAPYKIMFNESGDYLYNIDTNNNSLYTGLEDMILIYDCKSDFENEMDEKFTLIEKSFEYDSLFTFNYLSNSTSELDFLIEPIEESLEINKLEEEFATNNEIINYYYITQQENHTIENISIQSELSTFLLIQNNSNWIHFNETIANITFPLTLATKTISINLSNDLNNNSTTDENNSSIENSNSQKNANQEENSNSQYSFRTNMNNNSMNYLIIGGVAILIFISIVFIVKKLSKNKKNRKLINEAPLTLTQIKIMTYCDNYKHRYKPKEIVEQLVEQGYEKKVIIDTLWKYIEKEKQ